MKIRNILGLAVSFALAAAVAQGQMESNGGSVMMPAADMKWTDLDPTGAPGVKIADVWGNHATGAFGAFIKFPAGFTAPLHTHTNAMKIVVVWERSFTPPEGKPEVRLGQGSYLMQAGGTYRHTTSCDKASECLFFIAERRKVRPEARRTQRRSRGWIGGAAAARPRRRSSAAISSFTRACWDGSFSRAA